MDQGPWTFIAPVIRISHYNGKLTVKYAKKKTISYMLLSLKEDSCADEKVKHHHLFNN